MRKSPKTRYQVKYRVQVGTSYQTKVESGDTLWAVVQKSVDLLDAGNVEIVSIERVTMMVEPLSRSEADAVRLMTNGRVDL